MFLKIEVLCLAVLLSIVDCQDEGTYLDPLIAAVFGNSSTTSESPSVTESLATTGAPDRPEETSRETPSGDTSYCTCVPYNQCVRLDPIIDIHGIDDSSCPNFEDICCEPYNISPDQPTPTTPPSAKQVRCGRRRNYQLIEPPQGEPDDESGYGEFPWMVAVYADEEGNSTTEPDVHRCGGSLIHPQVVLTAAHCVIGTNKTRFMIRAGDWDTSTDKEPWPHQDREVVSIIGHPKFHQGALHNDVALLFLKTPVTIAEHVDIACLPPQGQVIENASCIANGWGIRDVSGNKADVLKKVELPILARGACQTVLRTTRLGQYFKLDDSFICAGGEVGKNTCTGDGGSPLVCPIEGHEGRYAQFGIVAWGIDGCFENTNPGVYANVALFRNWIDEQMMRNHLDFGSYQY